MRRRMAGRAAAFQSTHQMRDHGPVVEEVVGLVRLYKDGHVERPPAVPEVPSSWAPLPDVTSRDVVVNPSTGVWARFYVPRRHPAPGPPLLVYFHGGGFCVGSAAWSCYHTFLSHLASRAGCVIMSVNYRLAPEHRLPAAYEDGLDAVKWAGKAGYDRVYVGGDSAGAAIAYNAAARLGAPDYLKGLILIQPFFGAEKRTGSEKQHVDAVQAARSALTLATSDCYWRMALPPGANRDHAWCNPLGKNNNYMSKLPPVFVCVSEMDILKDRNLELCRALKKAGKSVEYEEYGGVGHAFQVLHNYPMSQERTEEMLAHIKAFLIRNHK